MWRFIATPKQDLSNPKQDLSLTDVPSLSLRPSLRLLSQDAAKKSSAGSSPAVSKASSKVTPHYRPSLRPATKIHTYSHSPSPSRLKGKARMFHGLDDSRTAGGGGGGGGVPKETFVPRKSIKTLIIQPKRSPVSLLYLVYTYSRIGLKLRGKISLVWSHQSMHKKWM